MHNNTQQRSARGTGGGGLDFSAVYTRGVCSQRRAASCLRLGVCVCVCVCVCECLWSWGSRREVSDWRSRQQTEHLSSFFRDGRFEFHFNWRRWEKNPSIRPKPSQLRDDLWRRHCLEVLLVSIYTVCVGTRHPIFFLRMIFYFYFLHYFFTSLVLLLLTHSSGHTNTQHIVTQTHTNV